MEYCDYLEGIWIHRTYFGFQYDGYGKIGGQTWWNTRLHKTNITKKYGKQVDINKI